MSTDINSTESMLAEIEKIKSRISERLTAYEKIDEAVREKQWEDAYQIASVAGINIYDPFATFREAREAVERADKSIDDVKKKREEVESEIGKIKTYEEDLRNLEDWYRQVIDIDTKSLNEQKDARKKILERLQSLPDEGNGLPSSGDKDLLELAKRLAAETKILISIDEPGKLQKIKNDLISKGNISEDFTWLHELRQKQQYSYTINRLYAKAQQIFLNQTEPVAGTDYQPDFDAVKQAFRASNQDDFRAAIGKLETNLQNEGNPLLRRIYQSDLHIWKQRLLAWERAVKLIEEVHGFADKVSLEGNCAREWSNEKNISTLISALLDLRDIPSEIFALKSDGMSSTLGEGLKGDFAKISLSLEAVATTSTKDNKIPVFVIDSDAKKEWQDYFTNMNSWLESQIANAQAFTPMPDETSQTMEGMTNKRELEFKPNTLSN